MSESSERGRRPVQNSAIGVVQQNEILPLWTQLGVNGQLPAHFLEVVNDVKERAVDAGNAKKLAMADTKRAPLTKTTMHK